MSSSFFLPVLPHLYSDPENHVFSVFSLTQRVLFEFFLSPVRPDPVELERVQEAGWCYGAHDRLMP